MRFCARVARNNLNILVQNRAMFVKMKELQHFLKPKAGVGAQLNKTSPHITKQRRNYVKTHNFFSGAKEKALIHLKYFST